MKSMNAYIVSERRTEVGKKMQIRMELVVWKRLPCGVIDKFSVFCTPDIVDAVRNKYKSLGYEVA